VDWCTWEYAKSVNTAPRPPSDLGPAGKDLWQRICGDVADGWELDQKDISCLRAACELEDVLAALKHEIREHGAIATNRQGGRAPVPAIARLIQASTAQQRLLGQIALEQPQAGTRHLNSRQRRELRAAQAPYGQAG
jgi:phage terminase small subunit